MVATGLGITGTLLGTGAAALSIFNALGVQSVGITPSGNINATGDISGQTVRADNVGDPVDGINNIYCDNIYITNSLTNTNVLATATFNRVTVNNDISTLFGRLSGDRLEVTNQASFTNRAYIGGTLTANNGIESKNNIYVRTVDAPSVQLQRSGGAFAGLFLRDTGLYLENDDANASITFQTGNIDCAVLDKNQNLNMLFHDIKNTRDYYGRSTYLSNGISTGFNQQLPDIFFFNDNNFSGTSLFYNSVTFNDLTYMNNSLICNAQIINQPGNPFAPYSIIRDLKCTNLSVLSINARDIKAVNLTVDPLWVTTQSFLQDTYSQNLSCIQTSLVNCCIVNLSLNRGYFQNCSILNISNQLLENLNSSMINLSSVIFSNIQSSLVNLSSRFSNLSSLLSTTNASLLTQTNLLSRTNASISLNISCVNASITNLVSDNINLAGSDLIGRLGGKYNKTGGTISGDVEITGNFSLINASISNNFLTSIQASLINLSSRLANSPTNPGLQTQLNVTNASLLSLTNVVSIANTSIINVSNTLTSTVTLLNNVSTNLGSITNSSGLNTNFIQAKNGNDIWFGWFPLNAHLETGWASSQLNFDYHVTSAGTTDYDYRMLVQRGSGTGNAQAIVNHYANTHGISGSLVCYNDLFLNGTLNMGYNGNTNRVINSLPSYDTHRMLFNLRGYDVLHLQSDYNGVREVVSYSPLNMNSQQLSNASLSNCRLVSSLNANSQIVSNASLQNCTLSNANIYSLVLGTNYTSPITPLLNEVLTVYELVSFYRTVTFRSAISQTFERGMPSSTTDIGYSTYIKLTSDTNTTTSFANYLTHTIVDKGVYTFTISAQTSTYAATGYISISKNSTSVDSDGFTIETSGGYISNTRTIYITTNPTYIYLIARASNATTPSGFTLKAGTKFEFTRIA